MAPDHNGSYYHGDLKGHQLSGSMLAMATWEAVADLCNRFALSPQTVIDLAVRKLQNEANSYGALQAWPPEKPKEPEQPLGGANNKELRARGSRKK